MLGTRQTGLQQLRVADLARDRDLLHKVEALAGKLRQDYPGATEPLISCWLRDREVYANV
jgi:ATP-dependent DNA helicase RecG